MATDDTSHFNKECKSGKTVYKRRSSIFHTRIATDQAKDNEGPPDGNKFSPSNINKEGIAENKTETFNLKKYIEELRQERKAWQKEYKSRKTQRKDLAKQKTSLEKQAFDISILTESDRAFLLTRPNYELICQNSQKTLDAALKISLLGQHIQKLNKKLMEKMENNISTATKNVIKLSEQ
ncbi:hypothetical protein EAG_00737 [Camponotus floridanus]|uniref:Uncharacterized protein n=1 Tax=Camponotus floridanus TaxID=104421 RepID=E2AFW8_CAMFO|nr:uncharacterized protein LOC105251969 [Camponotus floridanus]EFN67675.1 hypothetical protein EAG_00737 [Camponotus floridanus]